MSYPGTFTQALQPKELAKIDDVFASVAIPGRWDEDGEPRVLALQPAQVAKVLIGAFHTQIRNARIAYVFREKIRTGGRVLGGRAKKCGAELRHFAELDFILEFNWSVYQRLERPARVALIDHELQHCSVEGDDEHFALVHHDLGEFTTILRRHGAWSHDITAFLAAAEQIDLFKNDAPAAHVGS